MGDPRDVPGTALGVEWTWSPPSSAIASPRVAHRPAAVTNPGRPSRATTRHRRARPPHARRTRRLAARARHGRRHPARAEGRGHRRTRGGPQRALPGRRRRDRADRSEVHLERRPHQKPARDVGSSEGSAPERLHRRVPGPRQRLAEHLSAVPAVHQGRVRARPGHRRRWRPARLYRRVHHRPRGPARSRCRRPVPSPVLRVRQYRTGSRRRSAQRLEAAPRQLRGGLRAGGRPRGHRRRLASAHRLHRLAVHEAPVDPRPVLPVSDLPRAPDPDGLGAPAGVQADPRPDVYLERLLPLDRLRPRAHDR